MAGMAQVPCGARIGFLVAAIIFVVVQMRLFSAEQKYALRAASSVEFEEYCQKELRELGDKLLTQQTKLVYLEGEKIRLERENGKLTNELETSQSASVAPSAKRGMLNWRKFDYGLGRNFTTSILFENAQPRMLSQGINMDDTAIPKDM